jgi:hypothetical protein
MCGLQAGGPVAPLKKLLAILHRFLHDNNQLQFAISFLRNAQAAAQ